MEEIEVPECAVCLQTCNHPAKLPCGHIFCFLCMKGVAIRNKRCAMCRQDIPPDYLNHPVLLSNEVAPVTNESTDEDTESFQWYYEGRNGWWRYDERSNAELESSHGSGAELCQLLLAGTLYFVDFALMLQYRGNDVSKRRRVKRDVTTAPAKGVAGIKMSSTESDDSKSQEERDDNEGNTPEDETRDATDGAGGSDVVESAASEDAQVIPPPPQFDVVESVRSLSLIEEESHEDE